MSKIYPKLDTENFQRLLGFYQVDSSESLIDAQAVHVVLLEQKVRLLKKELDNANEQSILDTGNISRMQEAGYQAEVNAAHWKEMYEDIRLIQRERPSDN